MHKLARHSLYTLFGALFLTACGEEQELSSLTRASVITASTSQPMAWHAGEQIGIIVNDADGTILFNNQCYVTQHGDGAFIPASDADLITFTDSKVFLRAYSPFLPGVTYQQDPVYYHGLWTDQSDTTSYDFKTAKVDWVNANTSNLNLSFTHRFSRISISLSAAGHFTNADLRGVTAWLTNMNYPVTYHLMTDKVEYGQPYVDSISCRVSADGRELLAFVPPEKKSVHHPQGRSLFVRIGGPGGKVAVLPFDDRWYFEGGHSYHFDLVVKDDGAPVIDWNESADNSEILAPQRCHEVEY